MREYELLRLLDNPEIVSGRIKKYRNEGLLNKQEIDHAEIEGHISKAENNLRFIKLASENKFYDWAITGCYYACYHAALALIQTKGYSSKNHEATLLVLIEKFYKKGLSKEDLIIVSGFLDYEDVLFYVESKNKRENATYSTKTLFDSMEVENLRIKAVLFVNKLRDMVDNSN